MHNEDENRSIGYPISWIHFHTLLAVWSNLCMFCRLLIRLKMPSTIFWRRNVYGDNTICTLPAKKKSILLWPFIVIWRAWQHVQPISFFWLVNLEAGCRLISYSFYQQIHGGDIRPYSFNLLVFLVAEGANLLFVEISKALCCGSATVNLNQIPNLRHCFNFFFTKI